MKKHLLIGPYNDPELGPVVGFRAWDPKGPEVAAQIIELLLSTCSGISAEHVGSTAVSGCDGKGIIDILIIYPRGEDALVIPKIKSLGFQPQSGGVPHTNDCSMLEGSTQYQGKGYRINAHLAPQGSSHIEVLRSFRDKLKSDPKLLQDYIDTKRKAIEAGNTDRVSYTTAKSEFVGSIVAKK